MLTKTTEVRSILYKTRCRLTIQCKQFLSVQFTVNRQVNISGIVYFEVVRLNDILCESFNISYKQSVIRNR